jgi:ABC-type nitrate/sulfonate/bicarbonate transport system permease component
MEDFLLLFDELDDLVAMAVSLWRPIVGFLVAVALFCLTGFIFYSTPILAEAIALVLVILGVIHTFRESRIDNEQDATEEMAA